jgi:hypothetical protein
LPTEFHSLEGSEKKKQKPKLDDRELPRLKPLLFCRRQSFISRTNQSSSANLHLPLGRRVVPMVLVPQPLDN